jgi:hypothetical protein
VSSPEEQAVYIRTVFGRIRAMAVEARVGRLASAPVEGFEAGREAALLNVLRMMQVHAIACGLDRDDAGMSGFDPVREAFETTER